jgi:hypothetical protein
MHVQRCEPGSGVVTKENAVTIARLTSDELMALHRFIQQAGRNWKNQLMQRWSDSDCPPHLSSIGRREGVGILCGTKLNATAIAEAVRDAGLDVL